MLATDDLHSFRRRLAETVAWCLPRLDTTNPVGCLRSLQASVEGANEIPGRETPELHRRIVEGLIREREVRLRSEGRSPDLQSVDLRGGRLLACDPFASLTCGGGEQDSRGYINLYDVPPCDTWVQYASNQKAPEDWFNNYIVCWVPKEFVPLVKDGMACSCGWGLAWIEDLDTPLARQLEAIINS